MTAELSGLPTHTATTVRDTLRADEKLDCVYGLEAAIRGASSGLVRIQITHGSEPSVVPGNTLHKNRAPPD
jgi:hypothetical protein